MRHSLLVGVAAVAVTTALHGPVSAADLPLKAAPLAVAPWSWTGWYLGGHLGEGKSNWKGLYDPSEAPAMTDFGRFNKSGLVGGLHGGYNYQFAPNPSMGMASFVLGIEGDLSAAGLSSNALLDHPSGSDPFVTGVSVDWLASLRGRLGIAFDRVLVYGTGGVAWMHGKALAGSFDSPPFAAIKFTKSGYAAGVGGEYMWTRNLIVGVEWLHYGFNSDATYCPVGNASEGCGTIKLDHVDVVRGRISYKF